jgi:hypothetical protein
MLPILFHLVHLGRVFMPMYLPLVALAFFVGPMPAAITAALVPLLSGAVTGMPPFFPPVAVFMAIELPVICGAIAALKTRWPSANEMLILVPALVAGRFLYVGLTYAFSAAIELPAEFMAGLSLISGWPGVILMIAVIPAVARARRKFGRGAAPNRKGTSHEN